MAIEYTKQAIAEKKVTAEIKGKRDKKVPRPIEWEEILVDGVTMTVPLKPRAIIKTKKDIESLKLVPKSTFVASVVENAESVTFMV